MIDQAILINSVLSMFIMIIPGYLLRKSKLADGHLAKGLANVILYATQPALIISAFVRDYDPQIMKESLAVFALSFVAHLLFYIIAVNMFKKAEESERKVLQYALVFANAGYMGMPLMAAILGDKAVMFAAVYCIWFNVFSWSLGALIYTNDKKYLSPKKILLNPATIPTYIGILLFILPINQYIPSVLINVMDSLKALVAPLAMMMIGLRLAEVQFKGILSEWRILPYLLTRHFILPALMWLIMKIMVLCGLNIVAGEVMTVVLICAATPAAAATSIFAEKFGANTVYAGKLVAISSILSVLTIPIVALLLNI